MTTMKLRNYRRIFQPAKNPIGLASGAAESGYHSIAKKSYMLMGVSFIWVSLVISSHGQAVPLGEANNYSVLSYAGVTNSGLSVINGDVGLSPLTTITGFTFSTPAGLGIVNGTVHYNDGSAMLAQKNALTAYNTLAGMAYIDKTGSDLGGKSLTAGVYHFNTSVGLTGNLTLDNTLGNANSVFVFQIGSTLTSAVGSSITVLGVAPIIYWQVGSSATLNTGTAFTGNILALASVSFGTGSTLVNGRAIALGGAVTLLGNSLSAPTIALAAAPGSYWNGDNGNLWSGSNWSPTVANLSQTTLSAGADVVFSVTNPTPVNRNTDVDTDTTISSLTVNDTGAVTIGGTKTLTISSTGLITGININSGAGLTTISSNLVLDNLSQVIDVNNTDGLVISGVISGSNGLTKAGTGALTLTGTNTYTGSTVVSDGKVLVGNSSAFGVGRLNLNNGLIDTFNSQALQINVDGYRQTGGTIAMRLTSTPSNTNYNVINNVVLSGGNVFLYDNATTGTYAPKTGDVQTIITSTGLSGEFASNSPTAQIYDVGGDIFYHQGDTVLFPAITYDTNNAYVTWIHSFASLSNLTRNQTSASNMLDVYVSDNPLDPDGVSTYLDAQSPANLPALYDLIAPDELTSIFQIGISNSEIQNLNIERHLALVRRASGPIRQQSATASNSNSDSNGGTPDEVYEAPRNDEWTTFVETTGGSASVDSDGNGSAYSFDSMGVTIGIDRSVSDHFAFGILGSYTNTEANLANGGNLDVDSYKAAIYATAYSNGFYVDGLLGVGYNEYDSKRSSLSNTSPFDYADGSTDGYELDALINAGYDYRYDQWTLSPMASIAYTRVNMNGFTETGSMTPLNYPDQSQESLRSNLGVEISYAAQYGGMTITPQARLSWQHEFLDNPLSIDSRFASGNGSTFTVWGPDMKADRALISAGLSIQITPTLCAYAYYDGQLGNSRYSSNSVTAGVKLDF